MLKLIVSDHQKGEKKICEAFKSVMAKVLTASSNCANGNKKSKENTSWLVE